MTRNSTQIACALLVFYGILEAHVVDIHIPTATEIAEEQRQEQQTEINRAWEVFQDENSTPQEKTEALITLVDNEEIV